MPDTISKSPAPAEQDHPRRSWRDVLPVHPACLAYPPLGKVELAELGADIKARGLEIDIVLIRDGDKESLLDGRSRLDALEANGIDLVVGCSLDRTLGLGKSNRIRVVADVDPYALVASLNLHRRHLTAEQKRDLIAKLLQAKPEQSNVTIAKQVKVDDKTVAKVRRELEATSEIPKLEKTVGADGKARPTKWKPKVDKPHEPSPEVLAQRAESAARIRGLLGRDDHQPAGVDDDDQAAAGKRAECTIVNGTAPATVEEIIITEKPEPVEVAQLQARVDKLENEVRRRDIKIAGLEKEVRHLLQVRKAAVADDELSDRLTAKFNAAVNKGSKVQRSDGFESIINDILKSGCRTRIRATLPKADQSADQDPAPTEAPTATDTVRCAGVLK